MDSNFATSRASLFFFYDSVFSPLYSKWWWGKVRLTVKLSDLSDGWFSQLSEVSEHFTSKPAPNDLQSASLSLLSSRHYISSLLDLFFHPIWSGVDRMILWVFRVFFFAQSSKHNVKQAKTSRKKRAERSKINWSKIILIKSCIERRLPKRERGDRI